MSCIVNWGRLPPHRPHNKHDPMSTDTKEDEQCLSRNRKLKIAQAPLQSKAFHERLSQCQETMHVHNVSAAGPD